MVEHLFELGAVHPNVLVERNEATDLVGETLGSCNVFFRIPVLASLERGRNPVRAEVDEHVPVLAGL